MRVLILVLAIALSAAAVTHADPFKNCNTTEPTLQAVSTVILCDDFERAGTEIDDPAYGWQTASSFNTATSGYLGCGGVFAGAGASSCSIRGINIAPNGDAAPHNILDHTHATTQEGLTAIRFRFYVKLDAGYASNGGQKLISGQNSAHQAGIHVWRVGNFTPGMYLCPFIDCDNSGFLNPQTNGSVQGVNGWSCGGGGCAWLGHNLGNSLNISANGHWWYVEGRVVLNTPPSTRNGIWELRLDDCGTTGVCSGSPTLRASYTNIIYRSTSETLGGFFLDNWGNPADVGTIRIDQMVVTTDAHGPIGFMGAAAEVSVSNTIVSAWESVVPTSAENPRGWHRGVVQLPGRQTGGGLIRARILLLTVPIGLGALIGLHWLVKRRVR